MFLLSATNKLKHRLGPKICQGIDASTYYLTLAVVLLMLKPT